MGYCALIEVRNKEFKFKLLLGKKIMPHISKKINYSSFFSGIGGLEASTPASSYCEIDPKAQKVLKQRFPGAKVCDDIRTIEKVDSAVIAGGWPCQDISVAGRGKGLRGENSGLFYHLLRIAVSSSCESIVAENVSNILRLDNGGVLREVVREFFEAGYTNIAWREINARELGLPHHRSRVFFIASKKRFSALSLFRDLPESQCSKSSKKVDVAGFYWTAGTHSLNYSIGYVPTIKVGSSLSIPSPPAIHYNDKVRLLSPVEALRLQGFDPNTLGPLTRGEAYRMAGNAVAAPIGRFVLDGALEESKPLSLKTNDQLSLFQSDFIEETGKVPGAGYFDGKFTEVILDKPPLAENLADFVDFQSRESLSTRAAQGLLRRLERNSTPCPESLLQVLTRISLDKPEDIGD